MGMCWFMQELMASMSVSAEGQNSARVCFVRVLLLRGEGGQAFTSNAEFCGWM
jgi:hypothetical protein